MYPHERAERKAGPKAGPALRFPVESTFHEDLRAVRTYLSKRGLSASLAFLQGWYPMFDAEDNVVRVVIPAKSRAGLIYWQARAVTGQPKLRYKSPFGLRGDSIIVLHRAFRQNRYIALCEGPMDALALVGTKRVDTAIAMMGVQPPADAWSHALDYVRAYDKALIVADSDALTLTRVWLQKVAASCGQAKLLIPPSPYKDFAAIPPTDRVSIIERVL
jgi:hypothetical protein